MSTATEEISTTAPEVLKALGKEIGELHDLAERSMRSSLDYARQAGAKLIEAKALVKYGQWQSWIATQCGFSQATANLYMKIAREWEDYAESQRVGIFTLRDASRLLYMDTDDEHANAVGALVNLDLLSASDLDPLDPIERRTFVNELKEFYDDHCTDDELHEVPAEIKAKRLGRETHWRYNHGMVKEFAHRVLAELKSGEINRHNIRAKLREQETRAERTEKRRAEEERLRRLNEPQIEKVRYTRAKMTMSVRTPLQWYADFTQRFIWATRDLLTEGHGLLGVRVDVNHQSLCALIAEVKKALDTLEQQSFAREREVIQTERAALGPQIVEDDDDVEAAYSNTANDEVVTSEMATVS